MGLLWAVVGGVDGFGSRDIIRIDSLPLAAVHQIAECRRCKAIPLHGEQLPGVDRLRIAHNKSLQQTPKALVPDWRSAREFGCRGFDAAGLLNSMLDSTVFQDGLCLSEIGTPTMRPRDCELLVDTSTGFEENQFRMKSLGLWQKQACRVTSFGVVSAWLRGCEKSSGI